MSVLGLTWLLKFNVDYKKQEPVLLPSTLVVIPDLIGDLRPFRRHARLDRASLAHSLIHKTSKQ